MQWRSAAVVLLAMISLTGLGAAQAKPEKNQSKADAALTRGWVEKRFAYEVQHPYNLDVRERYSYDGETNTHRMWVNFSDKPHMPPPNRTNPRTELRIIDTYTTGEHMFEADVYVKAGTHASIMQVFGAAKRSTTFMLDAQPDGRISYYDAVDPEFLVLKKNANDIWWNLKVMHDPAAREGLGEVKVYIDNVLVATVAGHGGKEHYMKCGVYSRTGSDHSDVLFRNIRYWVKEAPPAGAAK